MVVVVTNSTLGNIERQFSPVGRPGGCGSSSVPLVAAGLSSPPRQPSASMGDVPRTDALWNKLACPREPTGSLSEAIYSPHTQRLTAGPASRASGWPPNRGPKSLAQPERPAANPAGACDARRLRGGLLGAAVDLHQLQIRPPRGGRLAAGAPASSSPPDRRCSPRRGLRRGQTYCRREVPPCGSTRGAASCCAH